MTDFWHKLMNNKILLGILLGIFIILFFVRVGAGYWEEKIMFGKADFTVFYVASSYALEGKDIYANQDMFSEIVAQRGAKGAVRYLYAPLVLIIFFPLTLLSLKAAAWTWLMASLVFFVLMFWLVQKLAGRKFELWQWTAVAGLAVVYAPLFTSLRTGQVNILLALLFIGHVFLMKNKKGQGWAGLILAAMIWIKLFPVIFLLYYALKKQYRIIAYTLLSLAVLLLISVSIFGIDAHKSYFGKVPDRVTKGIHVSGLIRYDNPTLNGLLYRAGLAAEKPKLVLNADKLARQLQKTELELKAKTAQKVDVIYYILVGLAGTLLLYATWQKKKGTILLVDLTAWLSFVFLGAKDGHLEYFVMFLPFFVFVFVAYRGLFMRKKWPRRWLYVAFILFCISSVKILPFVDLPAYLYIFPSALLGNLIVLIVLMRYYFFKK